MRPVNVGYGFSEVYVLQKVIRMKICIILYIDMTVNFYQSNYASFVIHFRLLNFFYLGEVYAGVFFFTNVYSFVIGRNNQCVVL